MVLLVTLLAGIVVFAGGQSEGAKMEKYKNIGGIVTPTEVSAIAVFYALIIGVFVYKTLSLKGILEELINTAKLTAIILFAIGTAAIYCWVFSYYRVPTYLVDVLGRVTHNPTLMLTLSMFCFIIVGCFVDAVPAIILLGPLLQPVVVKTEIDPMHFAIVSAVTLGVALITPVQGKYTAPFFFVPKICSFYWYGSKNRNVVPIFYRMACNLRTICVFPRALFLHVYC